ncbi:MAG: hypothetical protein KatS3mg105_1326 [Gemmatales bacterium]|nr:MAG: hypothetical protein KatS3mg105_1326 [Gemmatales bacterium]
MESQDRPNFRETIQHDFIASLVVFLVALPLCMGIAIASGVPVALGLITGIVGGLVVGLLAGSPLQVSGPAAGLTVIVYDLVQKHGLEMLGIIVLLAGLIQVIAGLLRIGQWFRAVSPAVIRGMLSGIGVLIFASQFHVMIDDKPRGSGLTNLLTIPESVVKALEWPELRSRDDRRFHTETLKQIGDLHLRQTIVDEQLAEIFPHHLHEMPANAKVDLSAVVVEQQRITDTLQEIVEKLQTKRAQSRNPKKAEAIREAARKALADSQAALAALKQGEGVEALKQQDHAVESLAELSSRLRNHNLAAWIGVITILIVVLWQSFAPGRLRIVPGPLIAVIVATAISCFVILPVLYVEVPDRLTDEIFLPHWAVLENAPWPAILGAALLIAAVASAETLLCANAVDQMHQGPRTKYDKELWAQGVGNMVCGFLGALPMTGVIVRSSVNVQAGAKTRLSAFLHGVWLLVFVVWFSHLLRLIPTASLAAILVYTGYKLFNPKTFAELKRFGWGEVGIYTATLCTIVVVDLLTGVIVGIVLAAAKLLYTFSHLNVDLDVDATQSAAKMRLEGAATFIRLPRLADELERVPPGAELHVDFQRLNYIDHACLDLLMNWAKQHESSGGRLVIDWDSLHARFNHQPGIQKEMVEPAEQPQTQPNS